MQKYLQIIAQIKDFWQQNHLDKVIIGLSGGIDSALSALLHYQALGREKILLVNLPSKHNSQLTRQNSQDLANILQCQYLILPIDDLLEETQKILDQGRCQISWTRQNFIDENIQARIRGATILAGLCGDYNAVFPCHSNKNELEIGYATIMGDLAGYASPLGDLWKSEIYQQTRFICHDLGLQLPESIFTVRPSAELGPQHNINQNLGDGMVDFFHEALFKIWTQISLTEIISAYENKILEKIMPLETSQVQEIYQLFLRREDFVQDLNYWWTLKQKNNFKRNFVPSIFFTY